MANLFPEGYESEVITAEDLEGESVIGYKLGVAFDYERGDFVLDGMNKMQEYTGIDSWKCWCVNCLSTERYKHLAYSTDFGISTENAMRASTQQEAESILAREISEALLADPYGRTQYVEEITFDWNAPDGVIVRVIVQGIEDVTIDITTTIMMKEGSEWWNL